MNVIDLAIRSDSHVLIVGSSGAGKTTLVKDVLSRFVSDDYSIIVFDPLRLYEDCSDIHAPLPISVLEVKERLTEIIIEALLLHYRNDRYVLSPMMEELLERAIQGGAASIDEVIYKLEKLANNATRQDVVLSATALKRRLSRLACWIFNRTHPVLREIRDGKVRGAVIGLDMSFLSDIQRTVYTLSIIEYTLASRQGLIYVVDEAHLFLKRDSQLFTEYLRLGRNLRKYFLLLTHSRRDLPESLLDIVRVIVEFPTLRTMNHMPLGTARVYILSRSIRETSKFIHVRRGYRKRRGLSFRRYLLACFRQKASMFGEESIDKILRDSILNKKLGELLLNLVEHHFYNNTDITT